MGTAIDECLRLLERFSTLEGDESLDMRGTGVSLFESPAEVLEHRLITDLELFDIFGRIIINSEAVILRTPGHLWAVSGGSETQYYPPLTGLGTSRYD